MYLLQQISLKITNLSNQAIVQVGKFMPKLRMGFVEGFVVRKGEEGFKNNESLDPSLNASCCLLGMEQSLHHHFSTQNKYSP